MASDSFPYKWHTKEACIESCKNRFDNLLTKYKAEFIDLTGQRGDNLIKTPFIPVGHSILLKQNQADYQEYNLISDGFIEDIRIRAVKMGRPSTFRLNKTGVVLRLASNQSVYDMWLQYRRYILEEATKSGIDPREVIYDIKPEVGTFRPSVMVAVIQLLRDHLHVPIKRVLDPCAGWGDRLIGSMASGVDYYVGVDPNPMLHSRYNDMVEKLSSKPFEYQTICSPFEDLTKDKIGDNFDLVFTSPPFFTVEDYLPKDKNQSITRYPMFNDWYWKFLIHSLAKSASCLRDGGFLVVSITDVFQYHFVDRMIDDVISEANTRYGTKLSYCGVICYGGNRMADINAGYVGIRPLWVWQGGRNPP